jgi:hypothetical protein
MRMALSDIAESFAELVEEMERRRPIHEMRMQRAHDGLNRVRRSVGLPPFPERNDPPWEDAPSRDRSASF